MHFLCLALVKQLMREGIGDVNTVIKAKQHARLFAYCVCNGTISYLEV